MHVTLFRADYVFRPLERIRGSQRSFMLENEMKVTYFILELILVCIICVFIFMDILKYRIFKGYFALFHKYS